MASTALPPASMVDALEVEAARLSELARSSDLGTPIAHLGRWKVRDVVAHLGGVHRWATRIVTDRSTAGPGFRKSKLDGDELLMWFDEGAAELVELFRTIDADEPCPNFNPGSPNVVGFWMRRQLHETTVHRWDVEAAGGSAASIDARIAVDGIDEFFDVFVRTRGKHGLDQPVVVETTRPKRAWTLSPAAKPGRIDVHAGRTEAVEAAVRGKPAELLLTLWGRRSVDEAGLDVTGDADLSTLLRVE